ncbi:MAG: 5-(carboxyamino)imidazole ribonucleotide synthase, partial [Spirochaetota bacterium]
ESVEVAALRTLRDRGISVHPAPEVLEVIQDKLAQRIRFQAAGLPVPRFMEVPGEVGARGATPPAGREHASGADGTKGHVGTDRAAAGEQTTDVRRALASFGLPAVQKLRFGGYDGRGVAVVAAPLQHADGRDPDTTPGAALPLKGPSLLEERIDLATELSVLVARSPSGALRSYPPFEMEMDRELHLVRAVVYPAGTSPGIAEEAQHVAEATVAELDGVGIFAVELFVDTAGRVLINEVAPRPHNSGHLTIEAAETDQFEQHLRAILDLPLGSTHMRGAAAMVNLIGHDPEGPTQYDGLQNALGMPGVHLHLYGKHLCRGGRKMGHVTATAPDAHSAVDAALRAAEVVHIHGGAALDTAPQSDTPDRDAP